MAGHRSCLVADAFHQASVAGDDIGEVIDQVAAELGGKVMFRHRHADRIGDALAERTGGGLDAAGVSSLGVAGGDRAQLAKIAQLVHRHVGIAGEVQQRIDQHRTMSRRQHEPVTVRPVGRTGVELQVVREQRGGGIRHTHRHSGVT